MNLTKNCATHRQSWRDSRQDRVKIFATLNLLLGENLGEIRSRIPARFWPPGFLLLGENLDEIRGRIQNLAGIPTNIAPGSRQDPSPYFTRGVLGSDMPMIDQWDGLGLNDLMGLFGSHVTVC